MKEKAYHFSLDKKLHREVMEKAGIVSLAVVIRALLRKWLKGEVEIDYTELTRGD